MVDGASTLLLVHMPKSGKIAGTSNVEDVFSSFLRAFPAEANPSPGMVVHQLKQSHPFCKQRVVEQGAGIDFYFLTADMVDWISESDEDPQIRTTGAMPLKKTKTKTQKQQRSSMKKTSFKTCKQSSKRKCFK